MSDIIKYEKMRDAGASPEEVYLEAESDGMDSMRTIWMIVRVFGVTFTKAKEISFSAHGESLSEHQGSFEDELNEVFEDSDKSSVKGDDKN